jgi:hypothetical protein
VGISDQQVERCRAFPAPAPLPGSAVLPRLLAVEVLLAEPEALQDDVLESCLYLLRDRLNGVGDGS